MGRVSWEEVISMKYILRTQTESLSPPETCSNFDSNWISNLDTFLNWMFLLFSGSKRSASYRVTKTGPNATAATATTSPNGLRTCSTSSQGGSGSRREKKHYLQGTQVVEGHRRSRRGSESDSTPPSPSPTLGVTKYENLSSSSTEDVKPKLISKMGKRNIKAQVKRFRMETKAAKTLGEYVLS